MQLEWIKICLLTASLAGCFVSLGLQMASAPSEQAERMGLSPQTDTLCRSFIQEVQACNAQQGKDCKAEKSREANCRDRVKKAYVLINLKCVWSKNVVVDCQGGLRTDQTECDAAQARLKACTDNILRDFDFPV